MGLKAIVDYALIREICENIKRDKNRFSGKIKQKYNGGSSTKDKKIDKIKGLLVSK